MKKRIAWMLVGVLCVSLLMASLAACSPAASIASTPGESTAPATTTAATAEPAPEPVVKLKLLTDDYSQPFPGGNQADIPELKYIRDNLGIDLTIDLLAHGQFQQLWQMRVASGDIGDFFLGYGASDDIVVNGGVQDLTALVDQYCVNAKQKVDKGQWLNFTDVRPATKGQVVGLPSVSIAKQATVVYVRKDWMDKLSLSVPTTSDEYLDVLRAFRDKDPNGNGQPDEIPFTARGDSNACLQNITGMWGLVQHTFVTSNGTIIPAELHPDMKMVVAFIKQMYDEKLIDQDFLINKRAEWTQKINAGLVGSWVHNSTLAWDWQSQLNSSIGDQNPVVEAIPTPMGVGNTNGFHGSFNNVWTSGWEVSAKCENPEAVVKLYDWLLSDEGCRFTYLGVPDVTFSQTAEGNVMYDRTKDEGNMWRFMMFKFISFDAALQAERDGSQSVDVINQAITTSLKDNPYTPSDVGLVGISAENSAMLTDVQQRFMEMLAEIVTGRQPIDYFDQWVADQTAYCQPMIDQVNQLAGEQLGS